MNILQKFKDRTLLLLCGLVCSVLAWGFFHYLQEDALVIMLSLSNFGLIMENRRLKKALDSSDCSDE